MRKLPFLNGIRAFEAAARAEGFAKAATELHVTPAAISRMVQLLEQRLGVPLFERKANRLALTAAGRAYQGGLTQIFDQLANLTAQVTAMAGSRVLTVGVGPTFATRWLIPRLADFQRREPEIADGRGQERRTRGQLGVRLDQLARGAQGVGIGVDRADEHPHGGLVGGIDAGAQQLAEQRGDPDGDQQRPPPAAKDGEIAGEFHGCS